MTSTPGNRPKPAKLQGYRRLLKWAALPVTDRRWAAPLSAVALGFGLFVGVAIGPGAAGTFATGAAQIIEIPGFSGGAKNAEGEGGGPAPSADVGVGDGGESSAPATAQALPSLIPTASSEDESESSGTKTSPASPGPSRGAGEPDAEEETLAGVVLHVNPAAVSYTIAEPSGTLDVVHAAKPPPPGAKVRVPVRPLANGTFAEAGARSELGARTRASFGGIVTFADPTPAAPAYTVSRRGASILVHVHPDPTGAPPALPTIGAFATVVVEIERLAASASASDSPSEPIIGEPPGSPAPGELPLSPEPPPPPAPAAEPPSAPAMPAEPSPAPSPPACVVDPGRQAPVVRPSAVLWQRQVSVAGASFSHGDLSGIVEAVCPESGQLLLSADDIRESGNDLILTVSKGIDTSKLKIGESILATATIGADASLSLTGLTSDERTKGADDAKAVQGDLVRERSSEAETDRATGRSAE